MKIVLATVLCSMSFLAFANTQLAPVVDADQDARNTQMESVGSNWQRMQGASQEEKVDDSNAEMAPPTSSSTESAGQSNETSSSAEVTRLSQQVANMTQMNMPQQISELRQKVESLQGEMEVAQRDLKLLSQQQAKFYQDLSQRIEKLQAGGKQEVAKLSGKQSADNVTSIKDDSNVTPSDSGAYQNAFKLLSAKQFDQANSAFMSYLKSYPKGRFVPNAHYWMGEIAFRKKAYADALVQFQSIIAQYPTSNKAPDAKLKVAVIHAKTGKKALAMIELKQIQSAYPGSTTAQLAGIELQRLKN